MMTEIAKWVFIAAVCGFVGFFFLRGLVSFVVEKWGDEQPQITKPEAKKSVTMGMVPNFDYAALVKGDAQWLAVSRLIDFADLMVDDFLRIKAIATNQSGAFWGEVEGLCDRAIKNTRQHISVISQRDEAAELAKRTEKMLMKQIEANKQITANRDELAVLLSSINSVNEEKMAKAKAEIARLLECYTDALKALENHRNGLVPKLVTTGAPSRTRSRDTED